MNNRIYLIGGGKGGVGKSLLSMAMIDLLTQRGKQCLVIESDTSNPDVYRNYHECTHVELLDLDQVDGWIELVNLCEKHSDKTVVINTGARNSVGVGSFGALLQNSLRELNRELVTLWVINTQRDSLELLRDYREAMPQGVVHVVRNLHHGRESDFSLYELSNTRQLVECMGGISLSMPRLAHRVATSIYNDRLPIEQAMKVLPLGNRVELSRWRADAHKTLEAIYEKA